MSSSTEIIINPTAYYAVSDAAQLLGVTRERLTAERKAGKLRVSVCGKSAFIRGQWIIDWIDAAANAGNQCEVTQ